MNMLLKLCVLEPKLLMAHVKSYSDLMVEGIQNAVSTWKIRMLMFAVALVCFFLGVVSAVMALLLWAALPVLNAQTSWMLWVLPATLWVGSWFFYALAKSYKTEPLFNDVKEQLNLDLLAICQATSK